FAGSITFTGHGGILNTTVSNPQLRFVDADTAILLLDVSGTTQEGEPVQATGVEFVELDLANATEFAGDSLVIMDAPAELLPEGAAAFGTYESGEPFDAVSAILPLDAQCAEAAPLPTPEQTLGVTGEPAAADSA